MESGSGIVEAAVIGGGAAGLGAAAELVRRGVEVAVLEQGDAVGSSWRSRYDGLRLNTVRWMSGMPGHRIPSSAGRWPSRQDFAAYLEDYARRRRIDVRTGVEVRRVDRLERGWRLDTSEGSVLAEYVVVATGYDRVPKVPAWPGRDEFSGRLIHSSEYRNPEPFRQQDVVVVGPGNTGTEVAAHLAQGGASRVRLSVRTPVNLMPSHIQGIPATVGARLADLAPRSVADFMGFRLQRRAFGDLAPYGMPRAPYGIATEIRVKGLGPVMDRGFVAELKAGRVEIVAPVERFEGPEVVLADGSRIQPDTVIAATGYRLGLEPLVGHLGVLTPSGRPAFVDGRSHPDAPRLYFNGYLVPIVGQLPTMPRTSRRIGRAVARERRLRRRSGCRSRGRSCHRPRVRRPGAAPAVPR
jgi:putative flavoprotein involved in K+ transport